MIEKIVPQFLRNCRKNLCGNGTADHANGPGIGEGLSLTTDARIVVT